MKRQAIALILANGISFFSNFLIMPLLSRNLSIKDNGTFGQINLISAYFVILFCLGIGQVVNIFLTDNKEDKKKVVSAVLFIQLLSGIIGCTLIYSFSGSFDFIFNNPELSSNLIIFLPSIICVALSTIFTYYYIFFEKAIILPVVLGGINLFKIVLIWIIVSNSSDLTDILIGLNLVNVFQFSIHLFVFRNFLEFKVNYKFKKTLFKLSLPFLFMEVLGITILYINGLFVSNLLGVEEFAIYRNGAIEIPFIGLISSSITSVALPRIVEYIKNNEIERVLYLKKRMSTTIAAITFPIIIFFVFNGEVFMRLYLGDTYVRSGVVFSIFSLATLIRINSYSDILTIRNKPVQIIKSNLFSLIIGIFCCFILTNYFGIIGTSLSYLISIISLAVFLVILTCKEIKISIFNYFDYRSIGKILFISILFGIPFIFFKFNILLFFILSIIYGVSVYFLILKVNLIERALVPERLRNIIFSYKRI